MTRQFFLVILMLSILGELVSGSYLPLTPLIVSSLDLKVSEFQTTVASFLFAFALAQVLLGPLSDRFGRRPVALTGVLLFILGALLAMLADSGVHLAAARAIQGVGAAATYVVSRAILRDVSDASSLASRMSLLMLTFAGAILVAPILGSLVALTGQWQLLFGFSGLIAITVLIWAALSLTETHRGSDELTAMSLPVLLKGYVSVFQNRTYSGYVFTHSFGYGSLYTFLATFPLLAADIYGMEPAAAGPWITLTFMGLVVGMICARFLSTRLGLDGCIALGVWFISANVVALVALQFFSQPNLYLLIGCQLFLMIGGGLIAPNTSAAVMLIFSKRAGLAAAGLGFTNMAVAALGAWLSGLVYSGGLAEVQTLQAIFGALSVGAYLTTRLQSESVHL